MVAHHVLEKLVLDVVGVLKLVDQDVVVAAADAVALLGGLEDLGDEQDDVLEVDRVGGAQAPLVRAEDRDRRVVHVRVARRLVGSAALLLVLVDVGEDRARRVAALVEVLLLEDAGDDRLLVGRVVDEKVRLDADRLAVEPEELGAGRVKGADPESARDLFAAELLQPRPHLAGGLVGERDGQDAPRRHARARYEIRDAVGDDARLAAARAGEHEQRTRRMRDRLGLGLVQLDVLHRVPPTLGVRGALRRGLPWPWLTRGPHVP